MKVASVSELKNQLSAHLELVRGGESVLVTDRRQPIAVLQPLAGIQMNPALAAKVVAGIVSPPKGKLDANEFLAMPRLVSPASLSQAVFEDREER